MIDLLVYSNMYVQLNEILDHSYKHQPLYQTLTLLDDDMSCSGIIAILYSGKHCVKQFNCTFRSIECVLLVNCQPR